MTLAIISLASMSGTLSALANSSGLFQQAEAYDKNRHADHLHTGRLCGWSCCGTFDLEPGSIAVRP